MEKNAQCVASRSLFHYIYFQISLTYLDTSPSIYKFLVYRNQCLYCYAVFSNILLIQNKPIYNFFKTFLNSSYLYLIKMTISKIDDYDNKSMAQECLCWLLVYIQLFNFVFCLVII